MTTRILSVAVLVVVATVGGTVPADADTLTLTGTPGDWVVDYDGQVVSLFWDTAHKENNTQGTLNEITNRKNNEAIILTFRQTTASTQNSLASGGLRVNFQKDDSNIVGPDWIRYELKLIDTVPGPNINFNDHPPQPHFHPKSPIATTPATFLVGQQTFGGDDTTKYQSSFLGQAGANDREYPDTIVFNNIIKKGEALGIRNLLIHERLFFGGANSPMNMRSFQLVETATVPEPNSFYLLGIGLVLFTRRALRRDGTGN